MRKRLKGGKLGHACLYNGLVDMMLSALLFVLFSLYLSVCHSSQFAHELFKYDNLELYPRRVVESLVVPREIDDVAYISLSAEQISNDSQTNNTSREGLDNPIVVKVVLEGLVEILWSTSLEFENKKIRHTSLAISPDGRKLYVSATFFDTNSGDHRFRVLVMNTEDGEVETTLFKSNMPGSQIIHDTAVNATGIYVCGGSTTALMGEDTILESIQPWKYLLCKISYSGDIEWQYTGNSGNKSCEAIQVLDNVYTAGNTWMNGTTFGVVYKHTSEGELIWGRRVRSTLKLPMRSYGILVNSDGIFVSSILKTSIGERSFVQKMSDRGTLLWSRNVGVGVPGGVGYDMGYVFMIVTNENGMSIVRLDKFAEGLEVVNVEIRSRFVKGTWVWMSKGFLVVSKTDGNFVYGIGSEGGLVDDSSIGIEEYGILLTLWMETRDIESVKDYLSDVTYGGVVRCMHRRGFVMMEIVVRSSNRGFEKVLGRLEGALRRDEEGRSELERELDIVVDVRRNEFRRIETEGSVGKAGTIVAIVVGVGFVVVVVCVWFFVSNCFSFVGERVEMV